MATSTSVSPSASGGSDELRRGMNLPTSNQPGHHLAMLQCLEKSKVNSSASSSTGTLTAATEVHDKNLGEFVMKLKRFEITINHFYVTFGSSDAKKLASPLENEASLVHPSGSNFYLPMKFLDANPINHSKSSQYASQTSPSQLHVSNFVTSSGLHLLS